MFSDGSSSGSRERVALCVRVASDIVVSRPTVGLMVDLDLTLAEVLVQALTFPDAFHKDDVDDDAFQKDDDEESDIDIDLAFSEAFLHW